MDFSRNAGPSVRGSLVAAPEVGKRLRLILDSGREVQTSIVVGVDTLDTGTTLVTTRRSMYQIRLVT